MPVIRDAARALSAEKKRRFEGNPGDVDILLAEHDPGQDAVQPAGAQTQGPNGFFFGFSHVREFRLRIDPRIAL
jgi:hypothetical protein